MKLVVMLNGHNHGIDGNSTGSTQSSTLFSGKERGIIYSVIAKMRTRMAVLVSNYLSY